MIFFDLCKNCNSSIQEAKLQILSLMKIVGEEFLSLYIHHFFASKTIVILSHFLRLHNVFIHDSIDNRQTLNMRFQTTPFLLRESRMKTLIFLTKRQLRARENGRTSWYFSVLLDTFSYISTILSSKENKIVLFLSKNQWKERCFSWSFFVLLGTSEIQKSTSFPLIESHFLKER
jgi:hypothetical protein